MSNKLSQNVDEYRGHNSKDATAISFAGAASIFVGTIGLFGGVFTGVFAMEILGAMLGVAGGFQFFQIVNRSSWGQRFGSLILSALYIISGLFIAATPVSSAAAATLLLGFLFISSGVAKAITTAEVSPKKGKVWLYTSSALSMFLGFTVVSSWPVNSVNLLGFMVSLELIFTGATFISIGSALREEEKQPQIGAEVKSLRQEEKLAKDDDSHRDAA